MPNNEDYINEMIDSLLKKTGFWDQIKNEEDLLQIKTLILTKLENIVDEKIETILTEKDLEEIEKAKQTNDQNKIEDIYRKILQNENTKKEIEANLEYGLKNMENDLKIILNKGN